jgi:two-component system phosphate regulon sensor histidine kinase PhoR
MNRIKINANVLVGIISLSLAGIIGLQAYLFRSAIMVRDARFKAEAAEALERVGKRLEALEAQRFLSAQFNYPYLNNDNPIWNDSLITITGNLNQIVQHADTLFIGSDGYVNQQFELKLDTNEATAQLNQEVSIHYAAEKERYKRFVQQRIRRIDTLFKQMLIQGMGNSIPFEGRFTQAEIDSVLRTELSQKGLNLTYEFGVLENGYLSNIKSSKFDPNTADFKVPLYKNDFFSGPKWLLISFPERINYLLQSMWYMLVLSGLFTAMIIIAFGYSLIQMQKQKKISQIKSDFINNMTHEFKTPIATISLAVDALSNPKVKLDEKRIEHYRKVIKDENKRMHSQVEKVLQLAMLDKQELELRESDIDLHELLRYSANNLLLQVEEKGGRIELELKAENTHVLGDELHLGNVFMNLLDNALKYADQKPVIQIRTESIEKSVFVSITDNGIGMTKEVQRKVFERFYRQQGGNVHDIKGHGLGLSYVHEIIEMHQGTIVVDSSPGKGSTFTIELPLNNQKV